MILSILLEIEKVYFIVKILFLDLAVYNVSHHLI